MKMTRLEWRYLQRIALDHPYYDTHKPPLSDAEARAIMEANNTMTGREFVDSIYAKLGMTRSVKEKKHFAWLSNIGELFTVPPIRKIAIAILVVLLMTVFFAATPTGRAIAESVIHYIATLFDDGRLVVSKDDNETVSELIEITGDSDEYEHQNDCAEVEHINSFDAFTEATGKIPIALALPFTELYYEYDEEIDYLALYATYDMPKGRIVTYQVWGVDDFNGTTSKGFIAYDENASIYYSIDEDGNINYIEILDDSVFTILSNGDYSLENLITMLDNR